MASRTRFSTPLGQDENSRGQGYPEASAARSVEPVFGVMREHLGLVRFLLRGLENVKAEWYLTCTAHNLRKLWKYWWRPRRLGLASE